MSNPKRIKLSNDKFKFECFICNKILLEPIKLPCNGRICAEHIQNLTKSVFECKSCKKEHFMHQHEFIRDLELQKQIDADRHLTANEKKHQSSINSLFEQMFELFADFSLKFNEFEYFNHEHFAELERQVEIRRENLKIQIDEISDEIIKQVKEKKQTFIDAARNISIDKIKERIERDKVESIEQFRLLNFSIQACQDLKKLQENNLKELQEKLAEFDQMKIKVNKIGFSSARDFDAQNFGKLIEKLNFLVKVNGDNSCELWNLEVNIRIKKFDLVDEDKPFEIHGYHVIEQTNLLTLCDDFLFRVFDLKSGNLLRRFGDSNLMSSNLNVLSNKKLTILEHEGGINFYNIETGALEKSLKIKNKKNFDPLAILENGNILCTFGSYLNRRTVQLIDFHTGKKIKSFVGHSYSVERVQLLSNTTFASGAQDEVKIWNIETGECLEEFDEDFGPFGDFDLSNDGKLICLYLGDAFENQRIIKIYDTLNSFECIKTIHINESIYKIKFHAHNKLVVVAQFDESELRVYDLDNGDFSDFIINLDETVYIASDLFDFCSYF